MAIYPSARQPGQVDVPEVVVARLPQYVRILSRLLEDGAEVVSSHQLGDRLQVTPAQIRKDLSYFGRFGKQGRGYDVLHLLERLKDPVTKCFLSCNQSMPKFKDNGGF